MEPRLWECCCSTAILAPISWGRDAVAADADAAGLVDQVHCYLCCNLLGSRQGQDADADAADAVAAGIVDADVAGLLLSWLP